MQADPFSLFYNSRNSKVKSYIEVELVKRPRSTSNLMVEFAYATSIEVAVDGTTSYLDHFSSKASAQKIQKEDIPFKVTAEKLQEIQETYNIPEDI